MIRILHISDLHHALDKIFQLKEALNYRDFDIIVLTGDLANLPNANVSQESELRKVACAESQQVFDTLRANFPGRPIYYILGNHDPLEEFVGNGKDIYLVHKNILSINSELYIIGSSGSCNAYGKPLLQETPLTYSVGSSRLIWKGYPHDDDKYCDMACIHKSILELGKPFVFISHDGPANSSTTRAFLAQRDLEATAGYLDIESGSKSMHNLLLSNLFQDNCVLHLHGHTHYSTGMSHIGKIPVVNAGPLRDGRFAMISIEKKNGETSWTVASVEFQRL